MDERQELNAGKAAQLTLVVLVLGALGVLGWEYLTTKEVTNTAAVVVLLGAGGLFVLFQRMFGAEAPRSVLGQELPTGDDTADRAARNRSYVIDALLFAAGITGLTFGGVLLGDPKALDALPLPLSGPAAMVVAGVVEFAVAFGITYLLNRVLGESQSRSVEKRLATLGAE